MKAKLKYLHSPDVASLQDYSPTDHDNFGIFLQLFVGSENDESEESFDLMLVTPIWLSSNFKKNDIIFGRHYIIVFEYNYQNLFNRITDLVSSLDEPNWEGIANKLGTIGKWEFEDYN